METGGPADTPMTIGQALADAIRTLRGASPEPRIDAEVLLSHVLARPRTFLRGWPETPLAPQQARCYAALISRRHSGVPVAQLTGVREFWSRDFVVTPDVLIPRPETELLVERILELSARLPDATLLDLATGSGAIAVTLAAELRDAIVYASDISSAALHVAQLNADRHAAGRVRWLLSDWFNDLPANVRFDLIVSNPPYIAESDPHLQQGDVRFEPDIALKAGPDGFAAFRIIAAEAPRWLVPGGRLLLEHGFEQAEGLHALVDQHGFSDITHHRDLLGHLRATEAVWPGP